jgi:serine/threonine protein kinase
MPFARQPNLKDYHGGRFRIVKKIGKGSFSTVYKIVDTTDNTLYALKALAPLTGIKDRRTRRHWEGQQMKQEYRAQTKVHDHPNVVSLRNMFETADDARMRCFILDLCPGGSLADCIQNTPRFWRNDNEIRRVFLQILDAVEHCHTHGLAHRDLKPDNILSDASKENFLVADFGLALSLDRVDGGGGQGTPAYMAPELVAQSTNPFDPKKADIWALGIILLQMITGSSPWSNLEEDYEYVDFCADRAGFLRESMAVSPTLVPLLTRIFAPKPDTRPTATELKALINAAPRFHMDAEEFARASEDAHCQLQCYARRLRMPLYFDDEVLASLPSLLADDSSTSSYESAMGSGVTTPLNASLAKKDDIKCSVLARAMRKIRVMSSL